MALPLQARRQTSGDAMRQQRYVTNELAHFVGRALRHDETAQYELFADVLRTGLLVNKVGLSGEMTHEGIDRATSMHGVIGGPLFGELAERHVMSMVCFCDIPEPDLAIHQRKYGRFGLSFRKAFLINKGARPVYYVADNTSTIPFGKPRPIKDRFNQRVAEMDALSRVLSRRRLELQGQPDSEPSGIGWSIEQVEQVHELITWVNAELLGYVKGFDATASDEDEENVYMEREWRTPFSVRFSLDDVSRIFLPREFAQRFREDFRTYMNQLSFVDPDG